MIAKHIPMKVARRSSFRDLVAYITHTQDKAVRIRAVRVTNCHQENALDAVHEVLATQLQNRRACSDKTYHLLISFDEADSPCAAALESIEDEICNALGFGEHQRVSCVHTDTDNLHIHVAINKIHPRQLTIHNPYCDYKALGAVCQRLEQAHGLAITNHETLARGARSMAIDMEHAAGVESLLGWIQRECLTELRQAQDWSGLHEALARNGLALQEKGNGLVISDQEGRAVKASSVAREMSKAQLEKRFGPFVPNDRKLQAARTYRMRPMAPMAPMPGGHDTAELYQRYQADRQRCKHARAETVRELRQQKQAQIEEARRRARLKRAIIKQLGNESLVKRVLYHQAGAGLRSDIQAIRDRHQAQCKASLQDVQHLAWLDWLARKAALGDQAALAALRTRRQRAQRKANCLLASIQQPGLAEARPFSGLAIDSVTKQGTILYRDKDSAIRDSGDQFEVSKGITQKGLEIALLMATQRFGSGIALTGDADFRQRAARTAEALGLSVTFDNHKQERGKTLDQPKADAVESTTLSLPESAGESAAEIAARRYIAEREAKRISIPGIPRHVIGQLAPGDGGEFAGWRRVDGQLLLLIKTGQEEIAVVPMDKTMARRVMHLKPGDALSLPDESHVQSVQSQSLRR